ncbi:MAG: MBL fold metallo-hydrolase [Clostridiales bacterium]|nr:MBL fold metallo-hydrolase [Clostridiales bacterium]
MKIKWLGHSSFVLTESTGLSVVTDPFDESMVGYACNAPKTDVVTLSHAHGDHNHLKAVPGYKKVYNGETGAFEYNGIHISGIPSFHDDADGEVRGKNTIYKFGMDGVTVLHMGDIGEKCSPELIERLIPVNVLLIPVGGTYTVDAEEAKEYVDRLMPDIVIPMHYKRKHCELDIDKVEPFLRLFDDECIEECDELDLDRVDFDESDGTTRVIVLKKC